MMVVTALLPPTGIPLPFFSQGGTNLFFTIILVSIVHKIIYETSNTKSKNKIVENDNSKLLNESKYKTDYEEMYFD